MHIECGHNIEEIKEEIHDYETTLKRIKFIEFAALFEFSVYVLDILMGKKMLDHLQDDVENFKGKIGVRLQSDFKFILGYLYYFLGDYKNMISVCKKNITYVKTLPTLRHFGYTLIYFSLASSYRNTDNKTQKKYKKYMENIESHFKKSAEVQPDNFKHLHQMVLAKKAWLNGNKYNAIELFDHVAQICLEKKLHQHIAICNEQVVSIYREAGNETAMLGYLKNAYYYYERWGCQLKLTQLQQEFPELLSTFVEEKSSTTTYIQTGKSEDLDILSIIKANNVISRELQIDKLLPNIMHILTENIGAERAVLIDKEKEKYVISAETIVTNEGESFSEINQTSEEYTLLPHTLLRFCIRAKEPVVIYDSKKENDFSNDQYIKSKSSLSVMCVPIIMRDDVVGAIYLENSRSVGVFTKSRLSMLGMLTAQIAISLENARYVDRMAALYRSFEKFVPKRFLKLLGKDNIQEIRLGDAVEKEITVLFIDMRGFTSHLEKRTSIQAFSFVNRFWAVMAPIIREYNGYIDQYQGDAVLAVFPKSADDAVNAGMDLMKSLADFNQRQQTLGELEVDIGIGLNTGLAMLGIIGEEERYESGVISDVTNTAARIESLNKTYGTHFLLSDNTVHKLDKLDTYKIRIIDKVQLKGKSVPTYMYEIIDWHHDLIDSSLSNYLSLFDNGFKAYELGEFSDAEAKLQECLAIRSNDGAAQLLVSRCKDFIQHGAPEEWDGTYVMTHK